jgi:membrane associated rhomboid family serine protease
MIPASVGFQCPECVGAAAKSAPKITSPFRGTSTEVPYVTYALLAINVLVFLWQLSVGIDETASHWGMRPDVIATDNSYWLLITGAFLHGSIMHLVFNMMVLFFIGPTLERTINHWGFIAVYLLSALGGEVMSFVFSSFGDVSIGASGAIFGLMGALVVAGRRHGLNITQVGILIVINMAFSFAQPGVDWKAHVGGLITGALVAAILVYAPRRNRFAWQIAGLAAVLFVLAVIAGVESAHLQDYLTHFHTIITL